MSETIAPHLVDAVLAIALLECAVLLVWHRRTGAGLAPHELLPNLAAGLSLMLALHGAVRDAGVLWIAVFLLLAGAAHGADLWLRWHKLSEDSSRRPQP